MCEREIEREKSTPPHKSRHTCEEGGWRGGRGREGEEGEREEEGGRERQG